MNKNKSEIEDLREFLGENKTFESQDATVIKDGIQFSIRIPKKFARMFKRIRAILKRI